MRRSTLKRVLILSLLLTAGVDLSNRFPCGSIEKRQFYVLSNKMELSPATTFRKYNPMVSPPEIRAETPSFYQMIDKTFANRHTILLRNGHGKDSEPISVMDTSLIRGKINIRTAIGGGWNHHLQLNGGAQDIKTSVQREFLDNTLFKVENVYDFTPGNDDPANKVMGTINVQW